MTIINYEEAKKALLEYKDNCDLCKDVNEGLIYISQCDEAIRSMNETNMKKLYKEILDFYNIEYKCLLKFESSKRNKANPSQATFYDSFLFLKNSIPIFVLVRIGKSKIAKAFVTIK